MTQLYIGTSGYTYKDWRGVFYPKGVAQKNWLAFYADHYNAVEINATFYRTFPKHVFAHWNDLTPEPFRFVLKAPRLITHEKALVDVRSELEEFTSNAQALGNKLAALLWQFPANAKKDALSEPLAKFLPLLPGSIRQVFEFRHVSWFSDAIYDLLNQHHAGIVINDSPRFPKREITTDHVMYVRFHGPGKLYSSSYSDVQLDNWAQKIARHIDKDDVYLFFNNTAGGKAIKNADTLRQLLTDEA